MARTQSLLHKGRPKSVFICVHLRFQTLFGSIVPRRAGESERDQSTTAAIARPAAAGLVQLAARSSSGGAVGALRDRRRHEVALLLGREGAARDHAMGDEGAPSTTWQAETKYNTVGAEQAHGRGGDGGADGGRRCPGRTAGSRRWRRRSPSSRCSRWSGRRRARRAARSSRRAARSGRRAPGELCGGRFTITADSATATSVVISMSGRRPKRSASQPTGNWMNS